MNPTAGPKKIKVSNPERILRVLQRVAAGGLAVQVRALKQSETAVKGRAVASGSLQLNHGFTIGGISERGRTHLSSLADGGLQIEFVLLSTKIVFYARMLDLAGNGILVSIPDFLLSIERRTGARFPVSHNTRAYIKLEDWHSEISDPAVLPFFEYQREFASLLHVGDVSVGGLSIVARFPAVCRVLQRSSVIERSQLLLPLSPPIDMMMEVRWVKRVRENVQDYSGHQRTCRAYRFGVQFLSPSEELGVELQKFMARLAVAEAI
ncbi:MAG: PilZ domain-containing protein [Proteobacteria bacterium]|nr:PilZ domain-containing protein [Pseudomonadota bacterium]